MSTTSSGSGDGEIGKRIREIRNTRKMTQQELAASDYSVSHISAVERGKVERPSQKFLEWCAGRLGVTVAQLQGETALKSADARWMREEFGRLAYEQIYAQLLITCGEIEDGLRRARRLRRTATAPAERTLVWFSAYGACLAGDLDAAVQGADEYRRLVEQPRNGRDPRGDAALHWLLGRIALAAGDTSNAHLEFARALEVELDDMGDPDTAQSIRRSLADTLRAMHDTTRAHQEETAAIHEYERLANPSDSLRWARARAEAAANAGDFPNAYMLIRWGWNSQRETAIHRHAAELYLRHATYADEDFPTARRETELRRAAMLAELTGDIQTRRLAGAYRALLLAERGALAVAEEVMRLTNAPDEPELVAGSGVPIADEQGVVVALARGWIAAASGEDAEAHRLAVNVYEALQQEPPFTRTDAKYAGLALWRLFDRLGDDDHAYVALRWVRSH